MKTEKTAEEIKSADSILYFNFRERQQKQLSDWEKKIVLKAMEEYAAQFNSKPVPTQEEVVKVLKDLSTRTGAPYYPLTVRVQAEEMIKLFNP